MNLPNILSICRLLLVPVFAAVYLCAQEQPWFLAAALILLLAGLTDMADGIIARRFGLITPLGKILDPLADKVMQVTVAVCLWIRFPALWPFAALLAAKETLQIAAGVLVWRRGVELASARWFGKLYTVLFYLATLAIVGYPQLGEPVLRLLLGAVVVAMIFAFCMYVPVFLRLSRRGR